LRAAEAGAAAGAGASPAPNRTVPKVDSPRPGLELPTNPEPQDFFRAHVFEEPLVPVGADPSPVDNAALAAALLGYARRSGPDDFSSLTGFLQEHPQSPWAAALLTGLGLEYYHTAHYSLAINAWSNAWSFAKNARDAKAVALVSRAFGELIRMDSRLGRMDEIERLLNSIGNHSLPGPAGQRVVEAREALWSMKNRPEISFRCGPVALRSIRLALGLPGSSDAEILKSASTQRGCSLPQVAELSRKIGLNYQMAFRNSGAFVVPSVVHWKVGHYAAMVRKVGELYELQDPTFGNSTWATKPALDAETSGYFLIGSGPLPPGWRALNEAEGATVWGKGMTAGNDPRCITRRDFATGGSCPAQGPGTAMAVAKVHLMDVNLNLTDSPVGYAPPVGQPVRFALRYNQRDVFQPANFTYANLGPQWTFDWLTYITDNPSNALADVNLYVGGGGQRTYTGFNTNTQSYAYQQYDQNLLTRTGPATYQLLSGDGSKMIFGQSDGSIGSSRNIFLTQEIDPQGNALNFSYDTNLCLVAVQDAIGQVTTLTYGLPTTNIGTGPNETILAADPYKLTSVTDPFGRTATFNYEPLVVAIHYLYVNGQLFSSNAVYNWGLASDTDVIGITSQFGYLAVPTSVTTDGGQVTISLDNIVNSLTTPYGGTSFVSVDNGNIRSLDIVYPDGSRERVEYNQVVTNLPIADPPSSVPIGVSTDNGGLQLRSSYYWDRKASALAYGDYSQARHYQWQHDESLVLTSGALVTTKKPLEGRVWFDYAGQTTPSVIASNTLPAHIGRVLDDGTTQLYALAYSPFGRVTNSIDPVGRTLSYLYDTNGIDLLEMRQTRLGKDELVAKMTYNSRHCPLTFTDPSGQTTTSSYNARGQILTITDPKNETTTFTYDANGYLVRLDGPLPGTNDTVSATYDAFGRVQTLTDVSGYTVAFAYDNLDRVTSISHPDGTSTQYTYNLLDCAAVQDRARRQTFFEYDSIRQLRKMTDPLGRVTLFEWCRCGSLKRLTDPMGRATSWTTDVQGRPTAKQYADGSAVNYLYETATSRLRQVTDENQQTTVYSYNVDDTLRFIGYGNAQIPTPSVTLAYDPYYLRLASIKDGIGTTIYSYVPITAPPGLGAGRLSSVTGPLTNEATTFAYDELGRPVEEIEDGDVLLRTFDAAGRITAISNALGSFTYGYDGSSLRVTSQTFPNGQATAATYGDNLQDFMLQQLTHTLGASPISQFSYQHDVARGQITTWSQQAGAQTPSVFSFGYDAANQLISGNVTNAGALASGFAYSYDAAGNRLSEQIGGLTATASYNALNQLSTKANAAVDLRTNEWDGAHRLTAVNEGNLRTEFGYDGLSRLAYIRQLTNGTEISFRRFVWRRGRICEERDESGAIVTKRYFGQGAKLETGANAGVYYYTRDHLGSVRELTDGAENVRARYSYDPFGRPTKVSGDLDADFGFAGMFWSPEASLALTHFRAYDPNLGRWLSRDPLRNAETRQGPNLYAYVQNEPVSQTDRPGLGGLPNKSDVTLLEIELLTELPNTDDKWRRELELWNQYLQDRRDEWALERWQLKHLPVEKEMVIPLFGLPEVACGEVAAGAAIGAGAGAGAEAGEVIEIEALEADAQEADQLAERLSTTREYFSPLEDEPWGAEGRAAWAELEPQYSEIVGVQNQLESSLLDGVLGDLPVDVKLQEARQFMAYLMYGWRPL
jgi:RHS repeat-associated protein